MRTEPARTLRRPAKRKPGAYRSTKQCPKCNAVFDRFEMHECPSRELLGQIDLLLRKFRTSFTPKRGAFRVQIVFHKTNTQTIFFFNRAHFRKFYFKCAALPGVNSIYEVPKPDFSDVAGVQL